MGNIIQNSRNDPRLIEVLPNLLISIDPLFEWTRYFYAKELMAKYGMVFRNGYAHLDYPVANPGRCYTNAMQLAAQCPELSYCEGFVLFRSDNPVACGAFYVMGHGWCALGDEVVDPSVNRRVQGMSGLMYVGIPIKLAYAEDWEESVGYNGMLDGVPSGEIVGPYIDPPSQWLERIKEKSNAERVV